MKMCIIVFETTKKWQIKTTFFPSSSCEAFVWNNSISLRLHSVVWEMELRHYAAIRHSFQFYSTVGICSTVGFYHLPICPVFLVGRVQDSLLMVVGEGHRGRACDLEGTFLSHSSHLTILNQSHVPDTQVGARNTRYDLQPLGFYHCLSNEAVFFIFGRYSTSLILVSGLCRSVSIVMAIARLRKTSVTCSVSYAESCPSK
jgi:hypothetical protein